MVELPQQLARRLDVAPDGLCIALLVPPEIAAAWPPEFDQLPHVTLVHGLNCPDEALPAVLEAVQAAVAQMAGHSVSLGDLGYFEQPEMRVAWADVAVALRIADARKLLAQDVVAAGVEVSHASEPWVPHATLAYLEPGVEYTGPLPAGSWDVEGIEIWRGSDLRVIVRPGSVEARALIDGSWEHSRSDAETPDAETPAEESAEATEPETKPKLETRQDRDTGSRRLLSSVVAASMLATTATADPRRAPAVHTESRVHTEFVYRADAVSSVNLVDRASRWRTYEVKYSRAGNVQDYVINGRRVREYRDPNAVFDPRSMASGEGIPWELRHSKDLLSPYTVRGVARGATMTVRPHPDGLHTFGEARAWDHELFDAIDHGTAREVSVAFGCKIDKRPGTADDGKRFDQRQFHIVWNSLASEPLGNAKTASVVSRLDAVPDAEFVTRADALLAIASAPSAPTKPVFYDIRHWVHREPTAPTPQPETTTRKDSSMKFLEQLLAAHGKSLAELAEALGVAEGDLETIETDEALAKSAVEFLASAKPPAEGKSEGEAAPPAGGQAPAGDGPVTIKIGDKDVSVPPEAANYIAMLEERVAMANSRADSAVQAKKAAEAEAQKRQDALSDMVSRADAEQLALDRALAAGKTIDLARRFLGPNIEPETRQDAAGQPVPLTLRDYQYAVIRGAYTREIDPANRPGVTEGHEIIARLDARAPEVRDALIEEYLINAEVIANERAHRTGEVRSTIVANNNHIQQQRADAATKGRLRAAKEKARAASAGEPLPPTPNSNAQGAA